MTAEEIDVLEGADLDRAVAERIFHRGKHIPVPAYSADARLVDTLIREMSCGARITWNPDGIWECHFMVPDLTKSEPHAFITRYAYGPTYCIAVCRAYLRAMNVKAARENANTG